MILLALAFAAAVPLADTGGVTAWDGSIVIDHGHAGYSEGGGAWEDGGEGWEDRGQSYSRSRRTKAGGAWARWAPVLPDAGTYRVYLWNIPYHAQDSRATIEIVHDGGTRTIVRVVQVDGKENVHCVSPWCEAAVEADSRAFVKLMERIRERDPQHQVVLMVQVENEMPSRRDYGPVATAVWTKPVPRELMDALARTEEELSPWLRRVWSRQGKRAEGTWGEVFGEKDDEGGRVFGAWSYGRFADRVAAAGKAVLPLPMFINAWRGESPCDHRYMDIVHAAAPAVDVMGPDVYLDAGGYARELMLSARSWNNLVVPENNSGTASAVRPWIAYGSCHALLYANYWGGETGFSRCGETYALMAQMAPVLLEKKGTGEMMGFAQEVSKAGETWTETFQGYAITFTAVDSIPPAGEIDSITGGRTPGGGWIGRMGPNDFVMVGTRVKAAWSAKDGGPVEAVSAEQGRFEKGQWVKEKEIALPVEGNAVRLAFPSESGRYGQFRFRLK